NARLHAARATPRRSGRCAQRSLRRRRRAVRVSHGPDADPGAVSHGTHEETAHRAAAVAGRAESGGAAGVGGARVTAAGEGARGARADGAGARATAPVARVRALTPRPPRVLPPCPPPLPSGPHPLTPSPFGRGGTMTSCSSVPPRPSDTDGPTPA